MAEEIIQPQVGPPDAPKYYGPMWYYHVPEPYHTTHIPGPNHQLPPPLKNAVQAIGHELTHPFGDWPLSTPHCDIRESRSAYYIDVELPGLREKKNVGLKWTGARLLFINAAINVQPVPEEVTGSLSEPGRPAKAESSPESSELKAKVGYRKDKSVHFVKRERKTGEFARAFAFSVDVEQDETTAKLAYGILTITVPKKEKDETEQHKTVDIEHAGH